MNVRSHIYCAKSISECPGPQPQWLASLATCLTFVAGMVSLDNLGACAYGGGQ
jgi:hypothetical protein